MGPSIFERPILQDCSDIKVPRILPRVHKIRAADLVLCDKTAYKNTWMLPYAEVIASMTSRNFDVAQRFHHVLTEGKWEFKRLLFKTSPCKAPNILVQGTGEWVPQLLSVFGKKS
ncbi:hypothetical protein CDAR_270491 [Caerostris darwini]|uniref:Uncharacterized protein n=1 Tax=Caerostris darwini TaxID=1538125 RepID=A0AAV4NH16_9ARAC|nr:hypothetical protein CDAR_270491 [Caerostris darwini]